MTALVNVFLVLFASFGESAPTQDLLAIQDAISAGKLDSAQRLIEGSLARYPHDGGLFNLRGVVHAQRQELSEARQDFAAAVHWAPNLTAAWQNLGRACQMEPNEMPCAIDAWQHVVRAKPSDTEANQSLSFLFFPTKQFRRVRSALRASWLLRRQRTY